MRVVWSGPETLVYVWRSRPSHLYLNIFGRSPMFSVVSKVISRKLQKNKSGLHRRNYLAQRQRKGFLQEDEVP